MNIKIKILSSEEFDRLPVSETRGADVRASIGFADTERGKIFVRDTGVDILNKYLIDHEVEHLFEAEGTDVDEHVPVIRHKLFAAALPLLAKAGGALLGGAKAVGSGIGAGASLLGGAAKGIGSTAVGAGKSLMSAFTPQAAAPALTGVRQGLGTAITTSPATGIPGGTIGSLAKTAASGAVGATGAELTKSGGSSLLSAFKPSGTQLLGTGLLASGLMKPLPKAPELPSSISNLSSQIQGGGSEIGRLGKAALTTQLNQQYDPMSEPEIQASLRQLEIDRGNEENSVRDFYRNIRPGSDEFTDSALRDDLNNLRERFAKARSDTVATRTRETKSTFDAQRTQQIQMSIGASDSEMAQLAQLAQLDVNQISQQLQIDLQQATLFKETFLNLGASLVSPPSVLDQFLKVGIGG